MSSNATLQLLDFLQVLFLDLALSVPPVELISGMFGNVVDEVIKFSASLVALGSLGALKKVFLSV